MRAESREDQNASGDDSKGEGHPSMWLQREGR